MLLNNLTIKKARKLLTDREISAKELTAYYLKNIEEKNKDINAYLEVFADALSEAEKLDKKDIGNQPLWGIPMAIKDNILIKGKICSAGSQMLQNYKASYDATTIKKLKSAGAVFLGRTNMDEFAMGASTENSAYGVTKNSKDLTRVAGGSSGGSAAAVAMDGCLGALGSDTGGSIRQPASFTGVVGLKPTYGRVSRYGLVAFASSFDCIGPFALTTKDAARLLQVIAGHDERDSTSARVPVPDYLLQLTRDVRGLKVGVPKEYFGEGLDPQVREAVEKGIDLLRKGGAEIRQVSLPHTEYTIATYYILATAEASSNLARYDGARYGRRSANAKDLSAMYTLSRSEGFGAEVKRRVMLGTYVLSAGYYDAYYRKGQKVRRLIQEDFFRAFAEVDCLVTPTAPTTAFRAGEKVDDPLLMYLSDIYTTSANLAGIPGISIPCGNDGKGLPIGLQILGRQFDEATVLKIADFLESAS